MEGSKHGVLFVEGGRIAIEGEEGKRDGAEVVGEDEKDDLA